MPENQPADRSPKSWRTTASAMHELHLQVHSLIQLETPPIKMDAGVKMTDCGAKKSQVIFALRDKLGLSLVDAKDLVSS